MKVLINECYNPFELSPEFMAELFLRYPPHSEIGKELFKHCIINFDNLITLSELKKNYKKYQEKLDNGTIENLDVVLAKKKLKYKSLDKSYYKYQIKSFSKYYKQGLQNFHDKNYPFELEDDGAYGYILSGKDNNYYLVHYSCFQDYKHRTNKYVIDLLEEKGYEFSQMDNKLVIQDIPDNFDYEIRSFSGYEKIIVNYDKTYKKIITDIMDYYNNGNIIKDDYNIFSKKIINNEISIDKINNDE